MADQPTDLTTHPTRPEESELTIRPMRPGEAQIAVDWAAAEGWNPGLHDAELFFGADPSGFLVAELDGQVIATIAAVNYDDRFSFIGLYIVHPEFRGRGYGRRLFAAAMEHAGARNTGLDAVVEQQAAYRRSGFRLAHPSFRFAGSAADAGDGAGAAGRGRGEARGELVDAATIPFETLAGYDRRVFPSERDAFLRAWVEQPDHRALALIDGDELRGFAVLRPCRTGHKVGPLFADDRACADVLLDGLTGDLEGEFFLDVPSTSPDGLRLAQDRTMTQVFETGRMYTAGEPELEHQRIFGITTFELG